MLAKSTLARARSMGPLVEEDIRLKVIPQSTSRRRNSSRLISQISSKILRAR
jgi:hypothetical protein